MHGDLRGLPGARSRYSVYVAGWVRAGERHLDRHRRPATRLRESVVSPPAPRAAAIELPRGQHKVPANGGLERRDHEHDLRANHTDEDNQQQERQPRKRGCSRASTPPPRVASSGEMSSSGENRCRFATTALPPPPIQCSSHSATGPVYLGAGRLRERAARVDGGDVTKIRDNPRPARNIGHRPRDDTR